MFGGGAAPARVIDEVGGVGLRGAGERARADADQAEFGAVGLTRQQFAAGGEYASCQLGRRAERAGAGAQAEVGGF